MLRAWSASIAHVTPHPWGPFHEVNDFIERVSAKLSERGHRVLIAAPSDSRTAIRNSAARSGRRGTSPPRCSMAPATRADRRCSRSGRGYRCREVRARARAGPARRSGTLEQLLSSVARRRPRARPVRTNTSSTALRHSRSLNVGSFHEPTERVLSLRRSPARSWRSSSAASTPGRRAPGRRPAGRALLPGNLRSRRAGSGRRRPSCGASDDGTVRVAFCLREERGALRLFLRALRRPRADAAWEAVVWAERPDPMP